MPLSTRPPGVVLGLRQAPLCGGREGRRAATGGTVAPRCWSGEERRRHQRCEWLIRLERLKLLPGSGRDSLQARRSQRLSLGVADRQSPHESEISAGRPSRVCTARISEVPSAVMLTRVASIAAILSRPLMSWTNHPQLVATGSQLA